MIIKEHSNLQNTGGYKIEKKRKNSRWLYLTNWGVYGSNTMKILESEAKQKEWI
jgi:hypothetical protein